MQLLQAFLRKRVPQILRHDPITVTQQAQRTENGRFHHVIAKPIRQNGEKLTENPEAFQSDPSPKPRFGLFCLSTSGLLIRFRFYEQFHIIDLRADRKPLAQLLPVYLALEILRRNNADQQRIQRFARNVEHHPFGKRHRLHVIRHHTHLLRNIADIDIRHLIASQSLFHLGDLPILLVQQLHITRLQRLQIDLIRVRCLSHHQFCRGSP